MSKNGYVDLSFIIPVYNEVENLLELYSEITDSCSNMEKSYEMIFIDDGSWDESFPVLRKIQKKDTKVKIIKLRKNFGQTAALAAGFDYANGEIIITLDADLQNAPEDFSSLIEKIEMDYDIVNEWRKNRGDPGSLSVLPTTHSHARHRRKTAASSSYLVHRDRHSVHHSRTLG